MEEQLNNLILAKESEDIGVEIEPEPVYLISKDSNNRLEMDPANGAIISASGGSLACRKEPDPTKSLNHPAIIDWALCEYLIVAAFNHKNTALDKDFDENIGRSILTSAKTKFDKVHLLKMFQNVVASSPGSITYNFGIDVTDKTKTPIILQHYNRVFIMNDSCNNAFNLHAAVAKKITPATKKKRKRDQEKTIQHDSTALSVLNANGVKNSDIPLDSEAAIKKITGIDTSWHMLVCNKSLYELTDEEIDSILNDIDYDKYLGLLKDAYEKNWRNIIPN